MKLPISLFIAWRYTRAKRRNQLLSFISLISILAIALGVAVLITVLSAMNGFQKELKHSVLSLATHISAYSFRPDLDWGEIRRTIGAHPKVASTASTIETPAMVRFGRQGSGVVLRGVRPAEFKPVVDIQRRIVKGSFDGLKSGEVVIGSVLAAKLKVNPGDSITFFVSRDSEFGIQAQPVIVRFKVVGIFKAGLYDFDKKVTFIHYEDAKKQFLGTSGRPTVVSRVHEPLKSRQIMDELYYQLDQKLSMTEWSWRYENMFRAVKQQKGIMFIILIVIVAVAAFSIVTTLIMMVTDKSSEIAVLRTIGAKPGTIMNIFLIQGLVIGLLGTLLGVFLGYLISENMDTMIRFLEGVTGLTLLPQEIYNISRLIGQLLWSDIILIVCSTMVISLVATLYPAWKAGQTKPAQALRFE